MSEELQLKPLSRHQSAYEQRKQPKKFTRQKSVPALEELLKCGICFKKLEQPRMLPCQHTFCYLCLQELFREKSCKIFAKNSSESEKRPDIRLTCPLCHTDTGIKKDEDLRVLPRNRYIDSILNVVDEDSEASPTNSTKTSCGYKCVKCQTVIEEKKQACQHCLQIFCNICWSEHLSELNDNLKNLVVKLEDCTQPLLHRLDLFDSRCDRLNDRIKEAVDDEITKIRTKGKNALKALNNMKEQNQVVFDSINKKIDELKDKMSTDALDGINKVSQYMTYHKRTSAVLEEVLRFGDCRVVFDPQTFKVEQDNEGIYQELGDFDSKFKASRNPYENVDAMEKHYKSKVFRPKLIWEKCPRPANVSIPSWDFGKLYVATTDNREVLVISRDKFKVLGRLSHSEMHYPQSIAFSSKYQEIYVSDKWKHCIHVFSKFDEYLRSFGSKGNGKGKLKHPDGIAVGPNDELYICDSGNDRIVVFNPQTAEHISTIGIFNGKGILDFPTGLAVRGNNLIVADSGNNRIKFFTLKGELAKELGSFGSNRGQFRSPEVVAVDPLGFVLVGDAGNARIQVFSPEGSLVKIFGGHANGFKWVSGICVSNELDIITTDSKARTLRIF